MGVVTLQSKAQAIVRTALKRSLQTAAADFDGNASTGQLARQAERAQITQKGEPPECVHPLMLAVLKFADSAGLAGSAHVYAEYRYGQAIGDDSLEKTCTINFYFWTEATAKGGGA
jgi:hypothetical protein